MLGWGGVVLGASFGKPHSWPEMQNNCKNNDDDDDDKNDEDDDDDYDDSK